MQKLECQEHPKPSTEGAENPETETVLQCCQFPKDSRLCIKRQALGVNVQHALFKLARIRQVIMKKNVPVRTTGAWQRVSPAARRVVGSCYRTLPP